jgi:hypothetical protein
MASDDHKKKITREPLTARSGRRWLRNAVYAIGNVVNWRIVRAIGELQILTRASYLLLVVVPLLAAFWPNVLTVVQGERQVISAGDRALQVASEEVDKAMARARVLAAPVESLSTQLDRLDTAVGQLQQASSSYLDRLTEKVSEDPRLPWTLAAAFFAALAVALGHFLYQLSVPEPVRAHGWDAFIAQRKEDFGTHRTAEALERAHWFLRTPAGIRVDLANTRKNEAYIERLLGTPADDHAEVISELSPTRISSIIDTINENPLSAKDNNVVAVKDALQVHLQKSSKQGDELIIQMGVVERGARAEYQYLARRNPFMIATSMVVYAIGLWLIIQVILIQAKSVASAAGLGTAGDLFLPK